MYIITILDVTKNLVALMTKTQFNDIECALNEIFKQINSQNEKAYINKIKGNQYIEVYRHNKGYLYDSKTLDHIYQILEIE